MPIAIEGSYSVKLEFTREDGGDTVAPILPVADRYCKVRMADLGGKVAGIADIDGMNLRDGATRR